MITTQTESLISQVKLKDPHLYQILRALSTVTKTISTTAVTDNSAINALLASLQAQINSILATIAGLSGGGSSTPPPSITGIPNVATTIGQVLISLDGLTFTPKLPVTDPTAGWLVDGGTGLMLVS